MSPQKWKFVEASAGSFKDDDGRSVVYDNIVISNGLRAIKCKNGMPESHEQLTKFKEGQDVEVVFDIVPKPKEAFDIFIISIKPLAK